MTKRPLLKVLHKAFFYSIELTKYTVCVIIPQGNTFVSFSCPLVNLDNYNYANMKILFSCVNKKYKPMTIASNCGTLNGEITFLLLGTEIF